MLVLVFLLVLGSNTYLNNLDEAKIHFENKEATFQWFDMHLLVTHYIHWW